MADNEKTCRVRYVPIVTASRPSAFTRVRAFDDLVVAEGGVVDREKWSCTSAGFMVGMFVLNEWLSGFEETKPF